MHKIISNTTPILSLLKISKLGILEELYGKIIIPNAVYQEIESGKKKQYYQNLKKVSWIEIKHIRKLDPCLSFVDLDNGEVEVLVLAKEE